ncbi:MAG: YbhB/YbcL family Raf kinase inhibitor-like protein [Thermoplasmata archaeon]|nr:MAG: YbhB/YbcL family Raf kinase inhibitor-like protein [Thermoplasmata archaeon]
MKWMIPLIAVIFLLPGCLEKNESHEKLQVSLDFKEFPLSHVYDGDNTSPKIYISGINESVKSIAIIMDDPDAPHGTFTHWLIWNIEAKHPNMSIPADIPKKSVVESPIHAIQGKNDFHKIGYDGPRPPPGETHHYHFRVYGLDTFIELEGGAGRDALEKAMKGHILQYGEAVATYTAT